MKKLYVVLAVCLLWACQVTTAGAEGFALTEWSSRGLSLAGGMVGRADDPSAIAYNAAGITQLPGTHVMGGFAAIAPMGTIDLDLADGSHTSTTTKPHIWAAPHAYITHQLNDRFWLGLGLFSRFGLGNEFADNWTGRYNLTNINITERTKELATIKVLGFYDREVSAYIYRETAILSLIGTAVGLVAGIFLHAFVVKTAEVDMVMFGRSIGWLSYVLAAALTLFFSLLVNLVMIRKLKKIDMVESMKAGE